jgi:MFS transporter, NNP family, nitrate/nitrite transporter
MPATPGTPAAAVQPGAWRALVIGTVTFLVLFWAWGLLAPLAPDVRDLLELSPLQVSLLVAIPVLLGSLARIPLGAVTDRYGGRRVFTGLCLAVTVPLVYLASVGSYPLLLVGALFLGVSGASFAVGVPFVSAWFPPARRGTALGIYGLGTAGTAIAAFTGPPLVAATSRPTLFLVVATVVAATAMLVWKLARDAPDWRPQTLPLTTRLRVALGLPITLDLAVLYAITFGGFVAFGAYLPTYLQETYAFATSDAAARAGGFIVLAVLARPLGGMLSDRYAAPVVLAGGLGVVAIGALTLALSLPLLVATGVFLAVAVALGLGSGAVFALVGRRAPEASVGAVTGFVGAAGGLGGFVPPLVMGAVFQTTGSFVIGWLLLARVAAGGLVHTWRRFLAGSHPAVA